MTCISYDGGRMIEHDQHQMADRTPESGLIGQACIHCGLTLAQIVGIETRRLKEQLEAARARHVALQHDVEKVRRSVDSLACRRRIKLLAQMAATISTHRLGVMNAETVVESAYTFLALIERQEAERTREGE